MWKTLGECMSILLAITVFVVWLGVFAIGLAFGLHAFLFAAVVAWLWSWLVVEVIG
jgi:hypothetical protein